jgi:hypothetical protein
MQLNTLHDMFTRYQSRFLSVLARCITAIMDTTAEATRMAATEPRQEWAGDAEQRLDRGAGLEMDWTRH